MFMKLYSSTPSIATNVPAQAQVYLLASFQRICVPWKQLKLNLETDSARCICNYIYIHIHVCHIYIHIYICMYVYIYIYIYGFVFVFVRAYIRGVFKSCQCPSMHASLAGRNHNPSSQNLNNVPRTRLNA